MEFRKTFLKQFSLLLKGGSAGITILFMLSCNSSKPVYEQINPDLKAISGNGNVSRKALTYDFLQIGNQDTIVDFNNYAVPENAKSPSNNFEGKLSLQNPGSAGQFREIKDLYDYSGTEDAPRQHLPAFDYKFVQYGSHIIPLKRGYLVNKHPVWEYILEPGRVWDENGDKGFSRVAIPFTLKQRNQNCVHNGVLMFLFKTDGEVSNVSYQIASETCGYFKFDMWGTVKATYTPSSIASQKAVVKDYAAEVNGRIPVRSISELNKKYSDAQPREFSSSEGISKDGMTLYGFVIDGVNYVGGCNTRFGFYPYCDVLDLPSYSTAKSIAAGLGLMRMEKLYPGSSAKRIGNLIPVCDSNGNWSDVTMENALDMTSGNYESLTPFKDEGASHTNQFFLPEDHKSKIEYSCSYYPRKAVPGTTMVYHTSDTYILGTAMNSYFQSAINNPKADYFTNLIVNDILKPLGTSPTNWKIQRTYDLVAQPFSGYGLIFHHDDIAKIGQFLNNGAKINNRKMLDAGMLASIMSENRKSGIEVDSSGSRYDNGFWLRNFKNSGICSNHDLIPVMEGYGGIRIFLLPNKTIYYYFSDNYEYAGIEAVKEANRIRPFCKN